MINYFYVISVIMINYFYVISVIMINYFYVISVIMINGMTGWGIQSTLEQRDSFLRLWRVCIRPNQLQRYDNH